ncbi:MAG: MBL fold metallo-hydrolase [Verrucomicrobia bacterium]|nr:MBL fold metallo-hydrolase [Verrucomicrobiota bacterium]
MKTAAAVLSLVFVLGLSAYAEDIASGVSLHPGPVNGVLVERQGKALAIYGLPTNSARTVDMVLLTHARRDVVWAAEELSKAGAESIVPSAEVSLLTNPNATWDALRTKRFHDYSQQSTKLPIQQFQKVRGVTDGDVVRWQDCAIRVIATPGYTRGAVTYILEAGSKKIAFTGDLVRDDGKLQDLFSLQDAIPEAKIGGYHGWAGRLGDLVISLKKVADEKPDLLVPARGPRIRDPANTIKRAIERIQAAYSNYLSIDALRWYFKDEHIRAKARRVLGPDAQVDWMPMGETMPLPPWAIAISNTRLIIANDGAGFLIDCGGQDIVARLRQMRQAKSLTWLEHVFVTHYHDDHTELLPVVVQEFGAKIHACGSLIDVLENPSDYRLPCLTRNSVKVTAPHASGDSWRWKEFKMTIFDFPGQTLHHNALLVEHDNGQAILFLGDSFTPSGIDDYCLQNRNILCRDRGYFNCLDQLERLPKNCMLVNQHVEPAFRFSSEQIARMRKTLDARISLLRELLPFDDPNFGMDEGWCEFHPYAVEVRSGQSVQIGLRITNHSPHTQTFRVALDVPAGWAEAEKHTITLSPRAEGMVATALRVPARTEPGLRVITADIAWQGHDLRRWAECMVDVVP